MTTIEQLLQIQRLINEPLYDELNEYLQGIRDIINLLNGETTADEPLLDTIKYNLKKIGE